MKGVSIFICLFLVWATSVPAQEIPTYTLTTESNHQVDDRLFGGFFEKATWGGEIGSDAAISLQTGEVFPEVKEYMEWMQIPILRYPGGTAINFYPWWRLIDSMPGEHATRPYNTHYRADQLGNDGIVTSDGRMGLHEFIALCEELDIEPLLVVNVGDAYFKERPIDEAARLLGANFVRYCNDTEGEWADLRAANGSPEPFNVKYWQIGNENWLFEGIRYKPDDREANIDRLTKSTIAYARWMKAADPSIELIIDGVEGLGVEVMEEVGDLIAYNTFHSYSPWQIRKFEQDGEEVPGEDVPEAAVWQGLATAPKIDSVTGYSIIDNWPMYNVPTPLAMTEWNLNTWFTGSAKPAQPENRLMAYGIGAASYLNAILRASDKLKIANQSMLVGTGWDITGIRVDTTEAERPQMYPTALATGLYSREHGNRLVNFTVKNARFYEQPYRMAGIRPAPKVAEQDVVVTADEEYYYLHIVNRAFEGDRSLSFVFPSEVAASYTQFVLSDQTEGEMSEHAAIREIQLERDGDVTEVTVPERSISVVKVAKQP